MRHSDRKRNVIISLFDHSGAWSAPYKRAGFEVIRVDIKNGIDIMTWDYRKIKKGTVFGILKAPPCTHFTVSGAQYWPEKDKSGKTAEAVGFVRKGLEIVAYHQPVFWVLENPVGRIDKVVPELADKRLMIFQPYEYGDGYSKKTILYGCFNPFLKKREVEYIKPDGDHHSLDLYLGISHMAYGDRKALRSITPKGFARAFFQANKDAETIRLAKQLRLIQFELAA